MRMTIPECDLVVGDKVDITGLESDDPVQFVVTAVNSDGEQFVKLEPTHVPLLRIVGGSDGDE